MCEAFDSFVIYDDLFILSVKILMKANSLILFYFLSFWHVIAQVNQDITLKIGGTHQKSNQFYMAPEKIKLDDAQISVLYQFKHGLVSNNSISFVTDTMVLAVGSQFSIYFDRNEKNRRESFTSYFMEQGPPKAFLSTPYGEFTETAINNSYLFNPSVSGETSQLYKDRKKDFVTIMDFDNSNFNADELFFFYEEEVSPINWKIEEDTMPVFGYTCTKATCNFRGRNYTAWFAQDIPINDGPYKFYGLPGLILQIDDSEKHFQFKAIGLEKMENTEIVIDDKSEYLKCTKEEYNVIKKRMQENFTVFYRKGILLHFSYRKSGIEYNPIEKM